MEYFDKEKFTIALENFIKIMDENSTLEYTVDGIHFVFPDSVFPSFLGLISSVLLNKVVKHIKNSTVLDLGTGSGVYAIFARRNNNTVVATDISDIAIQAAKQNAERNNLDGIDFRKGSIYEPINGEKFDYVVANLPFTNPEYCDSIKYSANYQNVCMDQDYFKELILNAPKYLKPNGRLYFTYGSSGNLELLEQLARDLGARLFPIYKKNNFEAGECFLIFRLSLPY